MTVALLFGGVILMGLARTPAGSYATDKAFRFVSMTLLAFIAPIVIVKSNKSLWYFFIGWIGFTLLLCVEALGNLGSSQRLSAFNGTTISVSRTIGVGIIILLFAVLMGRVGKRWKMLAAAILPVFLLVLVSTGSRGPLLMMVLAIAATVGIGLLKSGQRTQTFIIIGILTLALVGVFASGLVPTQSLERFTGITDAAEEDTSSQARILVMNLAWHLFSTRPIFGHGTGSISAFGVGKELSYPHNILLELAAENGLVGLGLYLTFIGLILWRLLSNLKHDDDGNPIRQAVFAIIVFTLLNAMVSGDLGDNRDLFLFAGLAIGATEVRKRGMI